ncbi:hypothetical protein RSOLAG1IB_06370 [Rhizoctonia solani AG-1 IB]|uniref:SET domain-containing protein n=1 Tax=Thanatephorus cucumeris (strain AG1-IB / isolate 7/3/14) TaxID=1108050 RepID=M5BS04_THACB|nr:hypothetical protein BN14_04013 [Rhizoctonia solani AG-1 IB]CEL53515.1 hypothetical protein RSOLAG1IB_06370 [Rhizoctonia solani AG-1 IB]
MSIDHLYQFPDLLEVDIHPGSFNSGLKSLTTFKKDQVVAFLTGMSRVQAKSWSTVQCGPGPNDHLELNSVLVYANHSCSPNVIVDVGASDSNKWHFRALKDISPGDDITFFYPSTEWDMMQAFDCKCQEKNCLGNIQGSKYLTYEEVEARGFVSPHIAQLMEERDGGCDTSSRNSD